MSPYITPLGKDRVIDLRVGDRLQHGQKASTIKGLRAYRDSYVDEGFLFDRGATRDGFAYRVA